MTRRRSGGGRVTTPRPTRDHRDELLPLRKRNPWMFWTVMIAVAAMVLSTLTGFVLLL